MNFEYLVCQMQFGKVTFVNGEWQGSIPLSSGDSQAQLNSCPEVWDYLARMGRSGWELVTATNNNITHGETVSQLTVELFMKRQLEY